MKIKQLLCPLDLAEELQLPDLEISGLAIDSRCVIPGNLFICLQGNQFDGHQFIQQAIDRGATAILTEKGVHSFDRVPVLRTFSTKIAYSLLAQQWTHQSWKKMRQIAVTGTTGKTTLAWFIYQLLNALGEKCGFIGTAGYFAGEKELPVKLQGPLTTPMPGELHNLYQSMLANECKSVAMEASSFGIAEKRLYGMQLDTALLTNLSFNHHVAYHGSWMEYVKAKKELFYMVHEKGSIVLNADDSCVEKFILPEKKLYLYGKSEQSDVRIDKICHKIDCIEVTLSYKGNHWHINAPFQGDYQAWNLAATFCAGLSMGYDPGLLTEKMKHIKGAPGRWEVLLSSRPFTVVIDKANTPVAFQSIKRMINKNPYAKKIAVFGNFGGGDHKEQCMLAKLIEETYDLLILTLDDPGEENIEQNFNTFMSFFSDAFKPCIKKVASRMKALESSLQLAQKNDLIVVLGRGNQKDFFFKNKKIPFNDVEIMKSLLEERGLLHCEN